jgi:phosphotransferase system enzyme I (PtsI)
MGTRETILRVMDIGGDKAAKFLKIPKEENPFMGWRAVRILLEKKELFRTQLRAIMKAGQGHNYKIMYPMVTALSEWKQLKEFTIEVANELGVECPDLGILFEVPLAILEIESFLKTISFASIGTNDLLQYLSAADRNNTKVNYLYNPLEPAFLRILKSAIDSCKDRGIPISICGEMAGNPIYTLLLIGLGLTRFSVIPSNIPVIKEIISNVNYIELQEEIAHILTLESSESITEWVNTMNNNIVGDIFKRYHIGGSSSE